MREIPGIPYQFNDPALLQLALSHRSVGKINNDRLEFLGDSILSCVVSARLFDLKPTNNEGELSRFRARVVRGETLAKLASELKLGDYIKLGEGEMKSGGFNRDSILADALEAILGAIYLDGGYALCAAVVRQRDNNRGVSHAGSESTRSEPQPGCAGIRGQRHQPDPHFRGRKAQLRTEIRQHQRW